MSGSLAASLDYMDTNASESDASRVFHDAFAPHYDDFTAGYQAASWTGKLLGLAQLHGAPDRGRLLDVGCGTGKSFLAMIDRGWEVVGCDVSPAMLEVAAGKVGEEVRLAVADARDLPSLGRFDLVWALNDTFNYMMSTAELERALAGAKRNLDSEGVLLFDLNTLATFRSSFSSVETREAGGRRMTMRGQAQSGLGPGSLFEAHFEAEAEADPAAAPVDRQRHFLEAQALAAIERVGLDCLDVWGDYEGEQSQPLDEERHQKAIYVVR